MKLQNKRIQLIVGKNPSVTKGTRAVAEMKQQRDFSPYRSASSGGWEALFDRRIGHRIGIIHPVRPWFFSFYDL